MAEFTELKASEEKWTPALMSAGFTIIPNVLLEHQRTLKLDALDINILFQLLSYWWVADNLPRPSKKTIAERIGVDSSTVRRRIAKLEKTGMLQRNARYSGGKRVTNEYDLTSLISRATPLAENMIQRREWKKLEHSVSHSKDTSQPE